MLVTSTGHVKMVEVASSMAKKHYINGSEFEIYVTKEAPKCVNGGMYGEFLGCEGGTFL